VSREFHERILLRLSGLFDRRLVQNNLRGLYVEAMALELLGSEWRPAGEDWGGWDIEHEDGTRLQVKQSAARQTWSAALGRTSRPLFDIKPALHWYGSGWSEQKARHADIYLFAWHPICDQSADHRDLAQWRFYVVETKRLPEQKSIGLKALEAICLPIGALELASEVERQRVEIVKIGAQIMNRSVRENRM